MPGFFQEVKPFFNSLDENGDGVLQESEIVMMLRDQGMGEAKAKRAARSMMIDFDVDGNGVLSLDEFAAISPMKQLSVDSNLVEKTFSEMDKDGNGYITLNELQAYVEKHPQLKAVAASKQILEDVDLDDDGKISRDEYYVAMHLQNS